MSQIKPRSASTSTRPDSLAHALYMALAVLSGAYILLFFCTAAMRASFPLQLEWLEGGVLDATGRVLTHQGVYVQPTHRFIPYIYTPLYYYVAAGAAKMGGLHFATLRVLSTLATAGCFVLVFTLARRLANGSRYAGLLAAGLFASLYGVSDSWYDLARVDMLFVLLVLAAIYASYRGHALLAGILFACAYQTKQAALLIAVFVLLHEFGRMRKLLLGLGSFVLIAASSAYLLNRASGGWYAYYTVFLPRHHALVPRGVLVFLAKDLVVHLLPALVLIGMLGLALWRRRELKVRDARFLIAVSLGTFLSAFAGRIHSGGSVNVVLQLDAWVAVLFGVALHRLLHPDVPGGSALPRRLAVLGLGLLQFAIVVYLPTRLIPSPQSRREANLILDRLTRIPGDVYVADNAADLLERGRPSFANANAIFDVLRGDNGPRAEALRADLAQAFQQREFSAIVSERLLTSDFPYTGAPQGILSGYDLKAVPMFPQGMEAATIEPPRVAPVYTFFEDK